MLEDFRFAFRQLRKSPGCWRWFCTKALLSCRACFTAWARMTFPFTRSFYLSSAPLPWSRVICQHGAPWTSIRWWRYVMN